MMNLRPSICLVSQYTLLAFGTCPKEREREREREGERERERGLPAKKNSSMHNTQDRKEEEERRGTRPPLNT